MKQVKLIAIGSAMALFMACNHADKNASSTSDSLSTKNAAIQTSDSLKNSLDNDKSALKVKLDSVIARTDVKLKELDEKIAKASKKEKKNLEADKARMQQRRFVLEKDMKEVDRMADTDWKKFKKAVSEEVDSLKVDL